MNEVEVYIRIPQTLLSNNWTWSPFALLENFGKLVPKQNELMKFLFNHQLGIQIISTQGYDEMAILLTEDDALQLRLTFYEWTIEL